MSSRSGRLGGASTHASVLRYLEATVVFAIVLPALLLALEAWRSRTDAVRSAQTRLSSDVAVAAQHALRVFDTTDVLLGRAFDLVGNGDDRSIVGREEELHRELERITVSLPHVQSLWVFSSRGRPMVSNRFFPTPVFDVSDREYFKWHEAGHSSTYVTEALISRFGGERFFDVSKRRMDDEGGFAGLISVSLRPEHFSNVYKEMIGNRKDGRVALLRADGRYVARWPALPSPETRLPSDSPLLARWANGEIFGMHDTTSFLDGSERLGAFQKVGTYPLYVYASVPRAEVEAEWLREMGLLTAFVGPVSLLLAWIAWVARQRTREQLEAAKSLELETAQRLRAEETLRQAQKLEAMGRLTGGVAHDFNNLLAVISNNTFLLKSTSLDDDHKTSALERIERAVASGTSLTRQLLSFTRRQALRPEVQSLQERLPALAEMLHTVLGSSIDCVVKVAPNTAQIEVDWAEMELAMLNLAVNSKDACSVGGCVTITARNAAPHESADVLGQMVVIEFADNGKGIEPGLLERVFEPFFTTKPVGEGTGLGLSQVHGFCARAHGAVRVSSDVGAGTTIRMYLPAASAEQTPTVRAPAEIPPALHCSMLVVDDNASLAESIRIMLQSIGCSVRIATSAEDALELLSADMNFDVVLSDIVMPGAKDGLALAATLKREFPDLPVVLMTGHSPQLEHARVLGFTVLPKPCPPRFLVETLLLAVHPG